MRKLFLMVALGIALGCMVGLIRCSEVEAADCEDIHATMTDGYNQWERVNGEWVLLKEKNPGPLISMSGDLSREELLSLLRECLEFIEDGSDQWPTYRISTLEGRPLPGTITQKEQEIKDAQAELDRLKRETALHKKIKQIIEQLQK